MQPGSDSGTRLSSHPAMCRATWTCGRCWRSSEVPFSCRCSSRRGSLTRFGKVAAHDFAQRPWRRRRSSPRSWTSSSPDRRSAGSTRWVLCGPLHRSNPSQAPGLDLHPGSPTLRSHARSRAGNPGSACSCKALQEHPAAGLRAPQNEVVDSSAGRAVQPSRACPRRSRSASADSQGPSSRLREVPSSGLPQVR